MLSAGAVVTSTDAGLDGPPDLSWAVTAARDGDEHAFRVLYRTVQPGLRRYLFALVGDDAEMVSSETWVQIARDIRSYRDDGPDFWVWAVSIARHRAMDHLRHHRRHPTVVATAEDIAHLIGAERTSDEAIDAADTTAAISWIAALPREQAEAILLRVVIGLDAESAARVLGQSVAAVRTAAYRGLRTLSERLDRRHANTPSPDRPQQRRLDRPGYPMTGNAPPAPKDER